MNVAVNLTWMTPGRVGGSEEYLTRQLLGLSSVSDAPLVELFVAPGFADAHPELAGRHPVASTPARSRAARIVLEHSWLVAKSRHADLVHHGGGTMPIVGAGPTVLTIHDLQYRRFPHYFSAARRSYLQAMVPRSARRATITAVPSEFVRRDVVDAFGLDADRVVVVPHGVPDLARPDDATIESVRRRLGVGERPYVVYPAITHPHKGHRVLVDMAAELEDDTAVVLIGGEGAAEADVLRDVARAGVSDRVVRPGRVPGAERDALVAGADALVFPSEFEGFGAPVVEAMALGTPVVTSNADALVEVVGDAAVVVAERSAAAWVAAIDEARTRHADLVAAGHLRRRAFTLATSGAAIAAAYRLAAS